MPLRDRILLSLTIGILAGLGTYFLPVATIYNEAHLGDLCPPLFSIKNFSSGYPAYGGQLFNNSPAIAYPFTTMLALYPFIFVPLSMAGPIFFCLSSALFAYALLREGQIWKVFVLLSPSYIFSLYSIQFTPLLASAILLPSLLPLACIKPQLGVVLCAAGRWSYKTICITICFVVFSLFLYPTWPVDWLKEGNLHSYAGKIPVLYGFGFLLLFSVYKWRDSRCRLLAAMSIIPQRLWYDQLLLYLIPETKSQLYILLCSSWLSLILSIVGGWFFQAEMQHSASWMIVVHFVYLPVFLMLYGKEIKLCMTKLKDSTLSRGSN